jgi:dihydroflavonol-4-reductase
VRTLVTGATGKVGYALADALVERGHDVRALVRDPTHATLPKLVQPLPGDVTDPASVERAVDGCELVFNAMGLPEQWLADEEDFERVNSRGTETVVRAAARAGARRVVHTSTIDVFDADAEGRLEETRVAAGPKGTAYERSKQHAEELALQCAAADGVEVVFVNPAAVYGPGPSASVSLDKQLFAPLARGRRLELPVLPPGGLGVVYSRGVAEGQLLAAERGKPGERYILCDRHVSFRELAQAVVDAAGRGHVPPTLPVPLARAMAGAGEQVARIIRRPPLLARGQLYFLLWNAVPVSDKAQRDLGWAPTPLDQGVRETLAAMDLV